MLAGISTRSVAIVGLLILLAGVWPPSARAGESHSSQELQTDACEECRQPALEGLSHDDVAKQVGSEAELRVGGLSLP